jgi:hypothetical protein
MEMRKSDKKSIDTIAMPIASAFRCRRTDAMMAGRKLKNSTVSKIAPPVSFSVIGFCSR